MKKTICALLLTCALTVCLASCDDDSDSYSGSGYDPITLASVFYDNDCEFPYATFDGSYIEIDTNPYDYDSDSSSATKYSSEALSKIKAINSDLGFPSYVYQDMMSTRALDGRQSYEGTRFSASWRYHPDSGLEVMYTEN